MVQDKKMKKKNHKWSKNNKTSREWKATKRILRAFKVSRYVWMIWKMLNLKKMKKKMKELRLKMRLFAQNKKQKMMKYLRKRKLNCQRIPRIKHALNK